MVNNAKALDFWEIRSQHPYNPLHDAIHFEVSVKMLKARITPETILEFGCGYGSLTSALRAAFPDAAIVATDAYQIALANAAAYLSDKHVELAIWDVVNYTALDRYDLVIGQFVLQHIPPEHIHAALDNLTRASQRWFAHVDLGEGTVASHFPTYQWTHDYIELMRGSGFQLRERTSIFHSKRNYAGGNMPPKQQQIFLWERA